MITQEIIRKLLDYDPETGKLTWRARDRKWFKSDRDCNAWNAKLSGKEAFTLETGGYYEGRILGKKYLAHRIIWLWVTGECPKEQIDHINHVKNDNRWCNLRQVSNQENGKNQSVRKTNTSGQMGVYFNKRTNKWRAYISVNGKSVYIGEFDLVEGAIQARKEVEVRYRFHENHGERNV